MSQEVRWGILGCGDVVERKSGNSFQQVERSRLVAVMRRSADLAEDFARRHRVPFWTTDADELIRHPEVDAVYVATPPGHHLEYALRVCAAGKPCLVEKPMGRSASEARLMLEAFAAKDLPLFVSYYRPYLPKFVKVKEILESGILGPITSIQYRYTRPASEEVWRLDPRLSGGGLFFDIGGHVLDLLDSWFGPLQFLGGAASNASMSHDTEDSVVLAFQTQDGAPGSASWSFASDTRSDRMEIEGLSGRLTLKCMGCWSPVMLEAWEPASRKGFARLLRSRTGRNRPRQRRRFGFKDKTYPHLPLIGAVVDGLLDGKSIGCTGAAAVRAAQLMDSALSEYYGGRRDSFWERPSTWASARAAVTMREYRAAAARVSRPEHRLSEQQVRFFYEQGYLGPFRLESVDLAQLQIPLKNKSNRHLTEPLLLEVCSHPAIIDRVAQLIGADGVELFKTTYWVKPAQIGSDAPWHQDVGRDNGGLEEDGSPVPTTTVWLSLDGAKPESGAPRLVPGSHRRLFGPWRKNFYAKLEEQGALRGVDTSNAVYLEAQPGEFYIFNSWILHASGPNRSESRRAAVNMRFVAPGNRVEPKFRYLRLREPVDVSG